MSQRRRVLKRKGTGGPFSPYGVLNCCTWLGWIVCVVFVLSGCSAWFSAVAPAGSSSVGPARSLSGASSVGERSPALLQAEAMLLYAQRMHDFPAACAALESLLPSVYALGHHERRVANASSEKHQPGKSEHEKQSGFTSILNRLDAANSFFNIGDFFSVSDASTTDAPEHTDEDVASRALSKSSRATLHFWVGLCEVQRAWQHELAVVKAVRAGEQTEALDEDVLRQRSLARATTLFWQGFRVGEAEIFAQEQLCTQLEAKGQKSQLAEEQLARILNGFMATYYDNLLAQRLGVPGRAAYEVRQLSYCLDDEQWWSVPRAVRAALDGLAAENADNAVAKQDIQQKLQDASASGLDSGVRLAGAIDGMMLAYWADAEKIPARLRMFFAPGRYANNDARRLWDEWAVLQMQHLSDRVWLAKTGARTPPDALGKVPTERQERPAAHTHPRTPSRPHSLRQDPRTVRPSVVPPGEIPREIVVPPPVLKVEDAL